MVNIVQMMQKAGQVKKKMADMQERAGAMEVTGEAAGVVCRMNGKFELKDVKIPPALTADIETLQDTIVAAVNAARGKAEKHMSDETQKIMAELGLPPGMGLPF